MVNGDFILQGSMIGTAAWSESRNEQSFSDTSEYGPERWNEDVARPRACFHPFSAGPGN